MKKSTLTLAFVVLASAVFAQGIHIGVFGGLAAYNGDLTDKWYPKKVTNGVIGISAGYELTDQIMLRAGINYAVVGGADRFSDKPDLVARNLSFETKLLEFEAVGEYSIFNLYDQRVSPFIMGGLAVYHFNPYAFNGSTQKIFLHDLSTEGQGIGGYPGRPYSLTQFAIPFGGGLKFAVSDNIRISLELGMRKLFTDYLDDVSGNYADAADLLAAKGQLAVDMAYRGDEVAGGNPTYPAKGAQRGSPKSKDFYYFTGLRLTYKLGGAGGGGGRHSRMGCPTNVY